MNKKIDIVKESNEKKLKDLKVELEKAEKELEAAKEKVAGIRDEMQEVAEEIVKEKLKNGIIVVRQEVTVRPVFPFWGMW